jgi:hypothetical protein
MISSAVRTLAVTAIALALAACSTRSISDSGYKGDEGRPNPMYQGELSPLALLGVDPDKPVTDEDIAKAMATKKPIHIRKGASVMLVQSGAPFPDAEMTAAMDKYVQVAGFTGVPLTDTRPDSRPYYRQGAAPQAAPSQPYSQLFRLAAAKGGYETIVVYWGVLEAANQGGASKSVSWIPIIGGSIPDQFQTMRIRLNMAVIDTRTGQWETFAPPAFTDEALSSSRSRAASDQEQVALLKKQAYEAAAEALARKYGG